MKKRLPPFMAGMLTMALVGSIGVSALAASGAMTITVDSINIQVNGQVFQPKDAKGNDVPVFALDGTTYAPLRALAEAYGLEVGYDQEANIATVGATEAPQASQTPTAEESVQPVRYEDFKAMWDIGIGTNIDGSEGRNIAQYNGALGREDFIQQMRSIGRSGLEGYMLRMQTETDLSGGSDVPSLEFHFGIRDSSGDMFRVGYVYFEENPPAIVIDPTLELR